LKIMIVLSFLGYQMLFEIVVLSLCVSSFEFQILNPILLPLNYAQMSFFVS